VDIPRLVKGLGGLLSKKEDPELWQAYTAWVNPLLRRNFPSLGVPEIMDLEEAPMLEENVREWEMKLRREERREGRQEGRQEGLVEGMQKVLLRQMGLRFGRLPQVVRRQVEQIASVKELEELSKKVLGAKSFREMGLG